MLAAASSCQMLNASCQMSFSHSAQTVLALRKTMLSNGNFLTIDWRLRTSKVEEAGLDTT